MKTFKGKLGREKIGFHSVLQTDIKNKDGSDVYFEYGLNKREYFAGLFMQALITNPERYKYISGLVESGKISQEEASRKNAHKAVLLADTLLEELINN